MAKSRSKSPKKKSAKKKSAKKKATKKKAAKKKSAKNKSAKKKSAKKKATKKKATKKKAAKKKSTKKKATKKKATKKKATKKKATKKKSAKKKATKKKATKKKATKKKATKKKATKKKATKKKATKKKSAKKKATKKKATKKKATKKKATKKKATKKKATKKKATKKKAAKKKSTKKKATKKKATKKKSAKKKSAKKKATKKKATKKKATKKKAAKKTATKKTAPPASKVSLASGDLAPDFDLEGDDGARHSLDSMRGKRFVLYFYPKDDTPGCTKEACQFSELDGFAALDIPVLGVSRDSLGSHSRFREKYGLTINLLSDPEVAAARAYGAWGEKKSYGKTTVGLIRSTFVVSPAGTIELAYKVAKADGHAAKVLTDIQALGDGPSATVEPYPEGTFCWSELITTDAPGAKKFYGQLFGWEPEDTPIPDGSSYTMLHNGGKLVGALYQQRPEQAEQGVPSHWFNYVAVDDAARSASKAADLGGTVIADAFPVMDAGTMAIVADPSGAVFGLWESGNHRGAEQFNAPGSVSWTELLSTDVDAAKSMYTGLFGWGTNEIDMGDQTYTTFTIEGRDTAGLMAMPSQAQGMPSAWGIYFSVENCDASVEKATSLGATLVMPAMDIPAGRFALLRDPQGAHFHVFQAPN